MKYLTKNRLYRLCLLTALLCVVGINITQAQQADIDELIQIAIDNGMNPDALTELRARAQNRNMPDEQFINLVKPAAGLAQEGLPADHVIQKALEGLSKGASGDQIVSLINRISGSTKQAAALVDPWMKNPNVQQMIERSEGPGNSQGVRNRMIEASSKAISQNVPAESVNEILNEISTESVMSQSASSDVITAIGILPDIASDQPEVAQSFVVRALKGGFNSTELQKLPIAVNMAQKRSQLPAAGVLEGVSQQIQSGTPGSQVLQNLFNGNVGGGPPGNIPRGLQGQGNPGQGQDQGRGNGQGRGNN